MVWAITFGIYTHFMEKGDIVKYLGLMKSLVIKEFIGGQ